MEEGPGWCDILPAIEREAEEVGSRKVELMRIGKRGQNFSIERILGRGRDEEEGEEERQAEEEEEEEELETEEGDDEDDDEMEDEDETVNANQELLRKEHLHLDQLLSLSPSSKESQCQPDQISLGRVQQQAILPRPPSPPSLRLPPTSSVPPTSIFFPTPSPFSQDPFLLTPIRSPRYSSIQ